MLCLLCNISKIFEFEKEQLIDYGWREGFLSPCRKTICDGRRWAQVFSNLVAKFLVEDVVLDEHNNITLLSLELWECDGLAGLPSGMLEHCRSLRGFDGAVL
ncbi:hypothetical protein H5410_053281 [Solanum commersonii]|uniref:Uncharacterized protein n=1 Tax=Solanum commersonii TaxID=4109 RepID=A0A9J5X5Y9_SOLCO|nr:hypothetical protein H5410_053281 [Solanum commersonii]